MRDPTRAPCGASPIPASCSSGTKTGCSRMRWESRRAARCSGIGWVFTAKALSGPGRCRSCSTRGGRSWTWRRSWIVRWDSLWPQDQSEAPSRPSERLLLWARCRRLGFREQPPMNVERAPHGFAFRVRDKNLESIAPIGIRLKVGRLDPDLSLFPGVRALAGLIAVLQIRFDMDERKGCVSLCRLVEIGTQHLGFCSVYSPDA